jgi:hypothetical protein
VIVKHVGVGSPSDRCWLIHCWRGCIKSVKLSKARGRSKVLTKWPAHVQAST